ncbi:hypothetical protein Hamer_G015403 [Homarus americanus]|uniref:Uncharacterized protein n=1 Tax=Homarus americanus TaxID=6706 RepID=A0A8J5NBK3_HOMAM|nr:hypothetical protein Hamer_G015403 [Homarus americanus]
MVLSDSEGGRSGAMLSELSPHTGSVTLADTELRHQPPRPFLPGCGRRRPDVGVGSAGLRRRPLVAVSGAGVWRDGGGWGGAGVERGALLAPPSPAAPLGGRGGGGRTPRHYHHATRPPGAPPRARTPGGPPLPRPSRPHTPRYHHHHHYQAGPRPLRQPVSVTTTGGTPPPLLQRPRPQPSPATTTTSSCTGGPPSTHTSTCAFRGVTREQGAGGHHHQQIGWCCCPATMTTVGPSDPLPGCLDADAAYVCTALAPSCFLIQKVREDTMQELSGGGDGSEVVVVAALSYEIGGCVCVDGLKVSGGGGAVLNPEASVFHLPPALHAAHTPTTPHALIMESLCECGMSGRWQQRRGSQDAPRYCHAAGAAAILEYLGRLP